MPTCPVFSGPVTYAELPGMRVSDCPQSTIPPFLLITPYWPDLVIFNKSNNSVAIVLELTLVHWTQFKTLSLQRNINKGKRNTKKYSLNLIDWEFIVFTAQLN